MNGDDVSGGTPRLDRLLSEAAWLRGLAAGLVRGGADADDLVQETWLAALRSPPDARRPARPWLGKVLVNAVRMSARSGGRRQARERDADALPIEPAALADELVDRVQRQRHVAELVLALDEPYRSALLLRYYEEKSGPEMAAVLGVPEGTVRWRINEGLARLRARLDEQSGGDRDRWRAWMLPLAGRTDLPAPAARGPSAVAKLLLVGGVTATIGAGVMWWPRDGGAPSAARAPAPSTVAAAEPPRAPTLIRRTTNGTQPTEEDQMREARMKKAAALFGVALPALVAGAGTAAAEQATRDEYIAGCVELREKTAVCKETFADFFASMAPPETPPDKRAKIRQRALVELVEDGTGPIEPRREKCAKAIDRERDVYTAEDVKAVRGCLAKKDCNEVLACTRPFLEKRFKKPKK